MNSTNIVALQHLMKDDILRKIIEITALQESLRDRNLYEELLDAIVSQQLSVKAANTIFNRFLDLFEDKNPLPERVLAMSAEDLRAVGLSFQKAGYIQNVATFFKENNWENKDWSGIADDEIICQMTQIKGVGKWTTQMILMFTLGREDVFPTDDLGIQQGISKAYGLTETGKALKIRMEEIAVAWQPYRSIACRYLWRWKDSK